MENAFGAAAHLAGQALRTGWYVGLRNVADRLVDMSGKKPPRVRPTRPTPTTGALVSELLKLHLADASNIHDGLYPPPLDADATPLGFLDAAVRMLRDLPVAMERQLNGEGREVAREAAAAGLPEYFVQNFHFQTGGYLTAESARLYDAQVETLFRGAANAMRRQAFRPIAEFLHGRDQRRLALVDVACGTGRFSGQLAQAFPGLPMTGVDLSSAYLAEAKRHLRGRRTVRLLQANAESLPLEGASQDIATCIFLYHELPHAVRRRVTGEIARVLKQGGLFVFVDSIQFGDRPDWDGILEAFPARFHEPYFEDYVQDDLEGAFARAGLAPAAAWTAFLSKVMVRRKVDQQPS